MKSARRELLALAVLLGVGLICYANSFHNEFVWDDHLQVLNNRMLRSWSFATQFFTADAADAYGVSGQLVRFYRPLWLLSEMVEYQLFGPSPLGFHVVNFLLHLGNGLLVYFVFRTLLVRRPFALLAAALFLCHPAHLETTTFIAGTVGVLSEFFMLVALLEFLRFLDVRDPLRDHRVALVFSGVAYALALLSKEIAVTFPGVALLAGMLLPVRKELSPKRWGVALMAYGLITVGYLVVRHHVLAQAVYPARFSLPERGILALRALAGYVGLAIAPISLYPEKALEFTGLRWTLLTISGVLAAAGLITSGIWFWKRDRRVTFGLAWFAAGFSLISNVVTVKPTFADRWLYWPLPGLLLAAAAAVEFILHRKRSNGDGVLVTGWCVVTVFSVLTIFQNRVWHDDVTLFETTIRRGGDTPLIRTALALTYMDEGQFDRAETHLQAALRKNPTEDTALWAMGACLAAEGQYAAATNWYARAIDSNPREMRTVSSLALAQEQLGDRTGAYNTLQEAWTRTGSPFIGTKLANYLYRQDRLADAGRVLSQTLASHPDYAPAHNTLGTVLFREDRLDEADAEFKQALRLDPWLAFAHANLAAVANKRGDERAAIEQLDQALRFEPENAGFYRALAAILEQHGRTNEAAQVEQRAAELEAKYPAESQLP